MALTLTSTQVQSGVARYWHAGLNCVNVTFHPGVSISPSTHVQMVKIPAGAVIVDIATCGNFPLTTGTYSVGDGSLSNRFITAQSLTASSRIARLNNSAGFGYTISVGTTVDAVDAYDTIDVSMLVTAGSETATFSLQMTVWYLQPPYSS